MPAYQKRSSATDASSNFRSDSNPLSKKVRVKTASQPSGFEEDLEQLTSEIKKSSGTFFDFFFFFFNFYFYFCYIIIL